MNQWRVVARARRGSVAWSAPALTSVGGFDRVRSVWIGVDRLSVGAGRLGCLGVGCDWNHSIRIRGGNGPYSTVGPAAGESRFAGALRRAESTVSWCPGRVDRSSPSPPHGTTTAISVVGAQQGPHCHGQQRQSRGRVPHCSTAHVNRRHWRGLCYETRVNTLDASASIDRPPSPQARDDHTSSARIVTTRTR